MITRAGLEIVDTVEDRVSRDRFCPSLTFGFWGLQWERGKGEVRGVGRSQST